MLLPQHATVRSVSTAHVRPPLLAIDTAFVTPETRTGLVLHALGIGPHASGPVTLPMPSAPLTFSPQQSTVPSAINAQPPSATEIARTLLSPVTVTGICESIAAPFPSWPK